MDITTTQILAGLGWAVIHSLWQGALAAIAVYMFRAVTKDSQAALRCGIELLALFACFAAFSITFVLQLYIPASGSTSIPSLTELLAAQSPLVTGDSNVAGLSAVSATGVSFYAPILGIMWCLGFILLTTRYAYGWWMTQKLRTQGLSSVPEKWDDRFQTLIRNAGIIRKVAIHISSRVTGPMTLGFFRPIVLVPASFFAGLPPSQIEAILLHEIAHIRRHDYLINLVQTAIKTILFYHPAIHYISKRVDEDREQACDDFAVGYTQNPAALAKGLAALRLSLTPPNFAMAATQTRNPLLRRLTRLMAPEESRRRPEQVVTSLAVLVVAAGLYSTVNPQSANAHPADDAEEKITISSDHSPEKALDYRFETVVHDGRNIAVKVVDNGSRWVHLKNGWHNIDKYPEILSKVPAIPVAPAMPWPESYDSYVKFEKAANQYRVNLDYYIASLENFENRSKIKEKLNLAKTQKRRVSEPNPDFNKDYLSRSHAAAPIALQPGKSLKVQPIAWSPADMTQQSELAGAPTPKSESGLYIDGKRFAPKNWTDSDDVKVESLAKEFEDNMEMVESEFHRALDEFEKATHLFSENPDTQESAFKDAQDKLAKAVLKANEKRDVLTERFDNQISEATNLHVSKIKEHEVRTEPVDSKSNYKKELLHRLKADGLIDDQDTKTKIKYKNDVMYVDGQRVPDKLADNYCEINKAHDIDRSSNMTIEITPNRLTLTNYQN